MMTLDEAIQHCKEKANGSCACADDHRQLAEWLTELAEKRKAEPQWIMCSERLPEEDGQYLITVKYKHVDGYKGVYAEHGDWFDGEWDMYFGSGHCGEIEDVIAWMPLPGPCKEGKNE